MENLTSNHIENFLNNIMAGVNRHPWLLSRNKIQLQNSIALPAKLSINMAFVHPTLSSDIAFNIGAIQKVRTLYMGGGIPKKRTKGYRGRGEVMQECTYAHNLANTRSFCFVLLCLLPLSLSYNVIH